ncbi:response regulator transcription factor [Thalassomonas actiniarum]|uniref:Response regulator transcription factor n=1 Tax=Thalassomonas actiniarum TaxID=485447 RepID=A0AAE9YPW6_9GAMM|nr:response regulator transcription factor [Thalassomonas actiniarum]WDD97382.1 response regulator transcription factor [Thalassomonas actiniarum]
MIVLFVEDDSKLAQQTINFLENEGIEVDYAAGIRQALAISEDAASAPEAVYDAVILDMNLPDGNGVALAKTLRNTLPQIPILFLTGQSALEDKVAAFEAGALDYLTKPFAMAELAIRLKLLARKQPENADTFTLADLQVNFSEKIIQRAGRAITLSPQQWQLLALLCRTSPAYVPKATILSTIWTDTDASNDMYKSLISRLRNNISRKHEAALLSIAPKQGVALREAD